MFELIICESAACQSNKIDGSSVQVVDICHSISIMVSISICCDRNIFPTQRVFKFPTSCATKPNRLKELRFTAHSTASSQAIKGSIRAVRLKCFGRGTCGVTAPNSIQKLAPFGWNGCSEAVHISTSGVIPSILTRRYGTDANGV